ncbi:LuxR C-terminal-related transcriptional regulator [Agrobacterium rhizogenes]|uniref:helix-turn-helix transcriptional regulator n=1 Tax=Rhizobium rhizogenes TaxID=359 RepID=UPI0022B5E9EF|nr:LuxR C-terminal-related transcriptional regulator [Rhizobium rhizogenes]MCZ7447889.1 LuxR C-terminal-related transcriptional regulator [Rhizobium rhizogenes]
MMFLPRTRLCRHIARQTAGVVFLRAPAGAGKSVLLEMVAKELGTSICRTHQPRIDEVADGCLLWDVPVFARAARMPAGILESVRFVVIACRPDQRISGLARQILHRGALTIGPDELALGKDEAESLPFEQRRIALEDFAGWPAFLALARHPDETLCIEYLRENYLPHLSPAQTVELCFWLENPSAEPKAEWRELLPPFLTGHPERHPTLLRLLTLAAGDRLATLQASSAVVEVASAFERAGNSLAAMAMLLDRGHETHAAQMLERAHGRELIYRSSVDRFREIIMRFSQDMIATNETVLFAVTRALLKQGELQRVRHLVGKSLGSDYLDPLKVLSRDSRFSFAARTFRLNLMIAEDLTPNDAMITRLGEFMADYPLDDHGKWAAYYNALLEFEIRRRNFREAEAAAARALVYLRKMGGQPLLEFFIHLHQIVLRLMSGDVLLARRAAQEARARLEQVPHDAAQEFRMLRLAEACLAYEAGKPRDLLHFVEHEFDQFAAAEIWPSLMQFALFYASQVLIDHFPMTVRAGFLDGLWIHLSEGLQFHAMMEIRTAIAYQNANRWADAAATLSAIRMPMGRNWVESAHEDLSRLTRRDEIAYVMAWLRDAVHLFTPRAYLSRQIDAMIANPKVTNREKVALRIWQSYAAHQRRDNAAARAHILTALESATRLGCRGVLSEERVFLSPLLNNRRIRSFIETSSDVRTALSIFADSVNSPQARALHGGLSQREAQMLQLLASGMSNKKIAQTLNISEVTVKFHLGNLFRKLDCNRRSEAIRAAKALDWL